MTHPLPTPVAERLPACRGGQCADRVLTGAHSAYLPGEAAANAAHPFNLMSDPSTHCCALRVSSGACACGEEMGRACHATIYGLRHACCVCWAVFDLVTIVEWSVTDRSMMVMLCESRACA